MQRYKSTYTGAQMDAAFQRAMPGGAIDQSMSSKLDWEGLINPEFTIAQAGIGGNQGSIPYAADCWKLVSGTVSAAPGGGLVLNGTIRQTLETAAGLDVVASIDVTSGTATAAYDDATKQFDITSSGGTIKRAHLGKTAITDWAKVPYSDPDVTLLKCQRHCQIIYRYSTIIVTSMSADTYVGQLTLPTPMRVSPAITFSNGGYIAIGGLTGWTAACATDFYNNAYLRVNFSKSSHGLSGLQIAEVADGNMCLFAGL